MIETLQALHKAEADYAIGQCLSWIHYCITVHSYHMLLETHLCQ